MSIFLQKNLLKLQNVIKKGKKMINIDLVLNKLKEITKTKSDTDLSEKLGKSRSTVAVWRKRKSLDFESIINFAIQENIDLNYLFKEDAKKQEKNVDLFEEFIFYNLKRTIFKESFFNKFNANLQFLFKVVKENIRYVNFTRENAKEVLIKMIKNHKIDSILDSDVKKENVVKFLEENLSSIECYVFLNKFEKFANM